MSEVRCIDEAAPPPNLNPNPKPPPTLDGSSQIPAHECGEDDAGAPRWLRWCRVAAVEGSFQPLTAGLFTPRPVGQSASRPVSKPSAPTSPEKCSYHQVMRLGGTAERPLLAGGWDSSQRSYFCICLFHANLAFIAFHNCYEKFPKIKSYTLKI